MEVRVQIPGQLVPGGWVVGGASRLLDVWTPSVLVCRAPAFRYPPHELRFSLDYGTSWNPEKSARFLGQRRVSTNIAFEDSKIVVDCRSDANGNVAHALQNHIGVALHGLRALRCEDRWHDLAFVIRPSAPAYIDRLFASLGFRVHRSGGMVSGALLEMTPAKLPLRAVAAERLREHALHIGLIADTDPVRESVFLARRGRRTLSNFREVEEQLNLSGYRTVYLEDLDSDEQIRVVASAKNVFGLHGAGMSFVMFRGAARGGVVLECFSSGFATNWVRANAAATGNHWVGGQGDLDSSAIRDMQRGAHSHAHEADNYRLDPATVKLLLRLAEIAESDPGVLDSCARLEDILAVRPDVVSLRGGEPGGRGSAA